jgi:hypothetical protein
MNKKSYRILWIKFHGIEIPKGWDIHHIDGNHFNNTIGNLLACPRKAHVTLHALKGEYNSANVLRGNKVFSGYKNPDHAEIMRNNNPQKRTEQRKITGERFKKYWQDLPDELRNKRHQELFSNLEKYYKDNPKANHFNALKRWENPSEAMKDGAKRGNGKRKMNRACCIYCRKESRVSHLKPYHMNNCKYRDSINDTV